MFEADAGRGMENMGQEDLALPFLKVLSGNDPILDENEAARKGDIYNTVTGMVYKGKDGVRVIPCSYQRRFIQWAPRGSGSGAPTAIYEPGDTRPETERSSDDNKDYVADGSGEYIEETHQHFVLLVGENGGVETALIAMKSTQLKKSRKWNSMMASRSMQGANGAFTPPSGTAGKCLAKALSQKRLCTVRQKLLPEASPAATLWSSIRKTRTQAAAKYRSKLSLRRGTMPRFFSA